MTDRSEEDRWRELFGALRRSDERSAPDFADLWSRAQRPAPTPPHRRLAPVWALGGLAAALLISVLWPRPESVPLADPLAWRSPTALLLEGPGAELLRTVPSLAESLTDASPGDLIPQGVVP